MLDDLMPTLLERLGTCRLRTDSGRDWQCGVMGDTASDGTGAYAPATFIGLTSDATAPAPGDTSLTGEITTGTLARAQGVYAHTAGTSTYTVTKTFTSDQVVAIEKAGLFTAASGGTLAFERLLPATADLVVDDQVQITWLVSP